MKMILVAGARPNFMKIAPIIRQLKVLSQKTNDYRLKTIDYLLVHTGQHYDYEMSKVFFEDLELPEPDIYLGVGSGTHAEQTGRVMIEFEKVLFKEKPDLVVIVGDVNSTLACALAASKINYKDTKYNITDGGQERRTNIYNLISNICNQRPLIAHVEAGLRSFDRTMPEEIDRILADPRRADMKHIVNSKIKFREPFRPFAPVILEKRTSEFFDGFTEPERHYPARYMLLVLPWNGDAGNLIPAVNHMGTGRLQTMRREWNPRYYRLVEKFGEATGVPVLMNTSFNLRGEPIVGSPANAWNTFSKSGIDVCWYWGTIW